MPTQPQGRWIYSWGFSKYFFIDEQSRIIDPEIAQFPKPWGPPAANNAIQTQRNVAPHRGTVAPHRGFQKTVVPVPRNVAFVPRQRITPAQRNVAPPANYAQKLAASTRRHASRQTASASVSSSGSSRSFSTKKSKTSTRTKRYQKVYLNRVAVLRKGPSLNTRVKENLEINTEITVDTANVVNIYYNDNLRKRIKVVAPVEGWVTVLTETGRLYRKCQASLENKSFY